MNKLCKEYINEIKAMFPVKGKGKRRKKIHKEPKQGYRGLL